MEEVRLRGSSFMSFLNVEEGGVKEELCSGGWW